VRGDVDKFHLMLALSVTKQDKAFTGIQHHLRSSHA
jgi:hypothetical protein